MEVLHYIAGPLIGAVIGYFTNYIAVKMLFYPRREIRILGHRLPFTPGAIPKGKARLAEAAGQVVAGNLMTKEDIEARLLSGEIESEIADAVTAQLATRLQEELCKLSGMPEEVYQEKKGQLCDMLSQEIVQSLDVRTLIQEKGPGFMKEQAKGTERDGTETSEAQQMAEALEKIEQQNLQSNEELKELVEEAVRESNMSDQIEISFTAQCVQLTMKGALLFESGSADLKEESKKVLDKAAVILQRYARGIIEIEGHTDNVPMSSAKYADNEELSSARALSVFYYLVDHSYLDPANLRHSGMGERSPIADNSTAEGRSRNRRVEIRIYNSSN